MRSRRLSARARGARALGLVALMLAVPACGEPKEFRHAVHPAGGKVTRQGKPVGHAMVVFYPTDPATTALPAGRPGVEIGRPTTQTDSDGTFSLSTYNKGDGAPAGDYQVAVIWAAPGLAVELPPEATPEGGEEVAPGQAAPKSKDKLGGKYADPAKSPLKASIRPGQSNRFEFALD